MTLEPLSVLYFTNDGARGGVEEHILTLMRGLDRSCFRLHWACPTEAAEKIRPDLPADVELIPLLLRKPSQCAAAARLAGIIRRHRIDVLHSHQFYASLFASPIGAVCRVLFVIETSHVREQWRQGWLKSKFVVDRLAGRCVDCYIAVSRANAEYLVQTKGLPARKVVVIHNGCDLRRFDPAGRAPASLKAGLGFGEDDAVLLVVGRLEPQKGHRVLLDAMPLIHRAFPRARLVCVGEGALRQELEAHVAALGLAGSVRFVGQQARIPEWFALADVVVLPSLFEGLPLVAIEALAAGKAMVATAVDGTPEVIVDGKTGLTVPSRDPDALAAAISRLLRDPELRQALGQAGRAWVEAHFSQEQQIQRTQDLYLDALHRSRPGNVSPIQVGDIAAWSKERQGGCAGFGGQHRS
jgi:glycosyltransferase involved in cell wall biosynthesis